MKPFNLEKCIAGEKVVTRDGREFKFGAYNKDATKSQRLVGWVDHRVECYYENGNYIFNEETSIDKYDLFMAEPVLYYAILQSNTSDSGFIPSAFHSSEKEVRRCYDGKRIIEIRTFEPK